MLASSALPMWERNLYSRLRQMLTSPGILRGSLVESRRTCGKEVCRCHKNRRWRHRALYLGVSLDGKTQMIYVPSEWEGRVREWVERFQQVREVLGRLSEACVKRLKTREE